MLSYVFADFDSVFELILNLVLVKRLFRPSVSQVLHWTDIIPYLVLASSLLHRLTFPPLFHALKLSITLLSLRQTELVQLLQWLLVVILQTQPRQRPTKNKRKMMVRVHIDSNSIHSSKKEREQPPDFRQNIPANSINALCDWTASNDRHTLCSYLWPPVSYGPILKHDPCRHLLDIIDLLPSMRVAKRIIHNPPFPSDLGRMNHQSWRMT